MIRVCGHSRNEFCISSFLANKDVFLRSGALGGVLGLFLIFTPVKTFLCSGVREAILSCPVGTDVNRTAAPWHTLHCVFSCPTALHDDVTAGFPAVVSEQTGTTFVFTVDKHQEAVG